MGHRHFAAWRRGSAPANRHSPCSHTGGLWSPLFTLGVFPEWDARPGVAVLALAVDPLVVVAHVERRRLGGEAAILRGVEQRGDVVGLVATGRLDLPSDDPAQGEKLLVVHEYLCWPGAGCSRAAAPLSGRSGRRGATPSGTRCAAPASRRVSLRAHGRVASHPDGRQQKLLLAVALDEVLRHRRPPVIEDDRIIQAPSDEQTRETGFVRRPPNRAFSPLAFVLSTGRSKDPITTEGGGMESFHTPRNGLPLKVVGGLSRRANGFSLCGGADRQQMARRAAARRRSAQSASVDKLACRARPRAVALQ